MNYYRVRVRIPEYRGFYEITTMVQAANITQAVNLLPTVVTLPMWPTHSIRVRRMRFKGTIV